MLDIRRMRVLREVGKQGSFSAAADVLNFTQSAVSQQIAALERESGATLVERRSRGVRLTEAGEVLARHADVILARLDDAEAELLALAGLRGGRLRIATFASAGASIMPRAIARFRDEHPAVEIAMEVAEPPDAITKLRAGDVDLVMLVETSWECATGSGGIERTHLLDDPMHVCLPADHPMASRTRVRLEDLADESWLIGSMGICPDSSIFLRACGAAGFEPRIAFHSDDYNAIQGFVAAGLGTALIAQLAIVTVRDDVVFRPLVEQPVRRIVAGTLEGGYRSPAVEAMLEILVDVGAEFAGADRPDLALVS